MRRVTPWGRLPGHEQWVQDRKPEDAVSPERDTSLAFAYGRTYGDACLADNGRAICLSESDHIQHFDPQSGQITCQAMVSLSNILEHVVPQGWCLPVSPGTGYVSIAGAIANDVHGKNHHVAGTFGRHVIDFELSRSDGSLVLCSKQQNPDLFGATVGGLGLTGIITRARLQLIPIQSSYFEVIHRPFERLDGYFEAADALNREYDYTVAWFDCAAHGKHMGRGVFMAARHAGTEFGLKMDQAPGVSVPFTPPVSLVNQYTVALYNRYYYYRHSRNAGQTHIQPLRQYLYPLDAIGHWNRIYGRKGFRQFQCVVPEPRTIQCIIEAISKARLGSFLAVLKQLDDIPSPGLCSFPSAGTTLALDFPNHSRLPPFLETLTTLVLDAGGRLYPAKDSEMSGDVFRACYPNWAKLEQARDPALCSRLWRRVLEA